MIDKAERIADGRVPLKKARFLKVTGAQKALDQATIDRARQLAGLKGYVTNLPESRMPGAAVINVYHDLWQVEASFRTTKSDLRARPVFHRQRDAIEAHLTVVFAALAIARHLQDTTGVHNQETRANTQTPAHRDRPHRHPDHHRRPSHQPGSTGHPRPATPHRGTKTVQLGSELHARSQGGMTDEGGQHL
jgi:hypothetical protein